MNLPQPFYIRDPAQPPFYQETVIRAFEPQRPYPQNQTAIVYPFRMTVMRAYYARPAQNAAHPDLPQVYFADDVGFQDRTSGMIEWTRIYTTLPNSWNDFESYPYNFPGYAATAITLGRNPFARTITSKVNYDYFIVGTLPTFTANLSAYDNFANAAWNLVGATASANATTIPAPAGLTTTAARLVETATTGPHSADQASTTPAGSVFGSVFLKADQRYKAAAYLSDGANYARVSVDLRNGTIDDIAGSSNRTIQAIDGGWWRIGFSGTAGNANSKLVVLVCDDGGNVSYAGDAAKGLFAWRAQCVSNALPGATVPPTLTPDNTNYPIASADFVPQKFATQFLYSVFGSNPNTTQVIAAYLSDGGFGLTATSPNRTTYNGWVTTDQGNTNSYSIESNDSEQGLWQGAIWERRRRFVKAR